MTRWEITQITKRLVAEPEVEVECLKAKRVEPGSPASPLPTGSLQPIHNSSTKTSPAEAFLNPKMAYIEPAPLCISVRTCDDPITIN